MQAMSFIGPAMSLGGTLFSGLGASAAEEAQAVRDKEASIVAYTQADQTDAQLREELEGALANIKAIRASTGVGASSPTGIAIKKEEERVSDRGRNIRVSNLKAQGRRSEQDSKFHRKNASRVLLGYGIKGLSQAAKAFY